MNMERFGSVRLRRNLLFGGGMVAAGWLTGLVLATSGAFSASVGADHPAPNTPGDDAVRVIADLDGGSHAFALHWRTEDELWYVRSASDGTQAMVRYNASTGESSEWVVPELASQTVHTYLVKDGDGLLWMAADYTIAAFDPRREEFVHTTILNRRPNELDPKAAEALPFGGSWITGLSVDSDGSVILARHDVLALYKVSVSGTTILRALDRAPNGLRTVQGSIQALAQENDENLVIGSETRVPLKDIGEAGCEFRIVPQKGATLSAGGKQLAAGLFVSPHDPAVSDADLGQTAIAVGEGGAVVRADCRGGTAIYYKLGDSLLYMDGLAGAEGREAPVRMRRRAESLAISPKGAIAVGLTSNQVALIDR